jgi:hypothetical protein
MMTLIAEGARNFWKDEDGLGTLGDDTDHCCIDCGSAGVPRGDCKGGQGFD